MSVESHRSKDYLVISNVGTAEKKMIWNDKDILPLDFPHGWTMAKVGDKICIFDQTLPSITEMENGAYSAQELVPGQKMMISLPPAKSGPTKRAIDLTVVPLQPLPPPYMQTSPEAYARNVPKQLMLYMGIRYFMLKYRPVGSNYSAKSVNGTAFTYTRQGEIYSITASEPSFGFKINGKKTPLSVGATKNFSAEEFFNAVFYLGVYWWRFRAVQTPESMPPIETEETEEEIIEQRRINSSMQIVAGFMCALLLFSVVYGKYFAPKTPISVTHIDLQPPKVIPHKEIAEVKPPPPPPPEPPKVVEIPKIEPIKLPEPVKPPEPVKEKIVKKEKPKPEKKVAKKEPPPKPEKAAPAPAKVADVKPQPKPPMVKADTPPASGVVAKKSDAPPVVDQSAQVLKSLSFLSSAGKAPKQGAVEYSKSGQKSAFLNAPTLGGGSKDSKVLDQMSSKLGDSNIKTKSARTVSSDAGFGPNAGKGLNDVQGKVSMKQLYGSGGGLSGLGDGSGVSVSGPGSLSEGDIEKALQKYMSRFQFCYEKALLTDSSLGGNLRLQWTITEAGSVGDSKVVTSQLNNAGLHSCVLGVLKQVKFPAPKGGSVTAKKTFKFSSTAL